LRKWFIDFYDERLREDIELRPKAALRALGIRQRLGQSIFLQRCFQFVRETWIAFLLSSRRLLLCAFLAAPLVFFFATAVAISRIVIGLLSDAPANP
jgi:hypothetical protein